MRVDVDLVVHAKIGKFILIQLSFLLLLNFILDTIAVADLKMKIIAKSYRRFQLIVYL